MEKIKTGDPSKQKCKVKERPIDLIWLDRVFQGCQINELQKLKDYLKKRGNTL